MILPPPQDTSCTLGREEPLAVTVETWTPMSGQEAKEDGSENQESRRKGGKAREEWFLKNANGTATRRISPLVKERHQEWVLKGGS